MSWLQFGRSPTKPHDQEIAQVGLRMGTRASA